MLLEQSGVDVDEYREQLLHATGQISEDLLDGKLLASIAAESTLAAREWLVENGLSIIARSFAFILILLAFWALSRIAARLVERAMLSDRVNVSALLQELSRRFVANLVLALGFMVALSQVGVSIGPLLAGLGVAGFVIGFALQDSLSNFASGIMILFYRPFDVDAFFGEQLKVFATSAAVVEDRVVSIEIAEFFEQLERGRKMLPTDGGSVSLNLDGLRVGLIGGFLTYHQVMPDNLDSFVS